jgi:catechol 2,3-dioxygenase-like lactoylglutathione lyase family enzyme
MPSEGVAQPWAIRSTLISVTNLERSAAFYRELGGFEEIFRDDGVAILGGLSTGSFVLILRESRSPFSAHHGQESLGLRSITFSIGSLDEMDRIESVLRDREFFISRRQMLGDASELIRGRDPDNLPLVFVCYARDVLDVDYYRFVAEMAHSLDT